MECIFFLDYILKSNLIICVFKSISPICLKLLLLVIRLVLFFIAIGLIVSSPFFFVPNLYILCSLPITHKFYVIFFYFMLKNLK